MNIFCGKQNDSPNNPKNCADKLNLPKIVLVGNPNVGKSVFFNKLTGFYVEVSNYPGTTVDISRAIIDEVEVIDTPGIYGIGSFNEEEIVAKKIIIQADKIINVVSALSLERDLFLTQQLIDMDYKIIVVLNQTDEAKARGIKIDIDALENMLGVKVIPTVAIKNQGINEAKDNIKNAKTGNKTEYSEEILTDSILNLEENPEKREIIYSERRKRVNEIVEAVLSRTDHGINISTRFGKLLLNPIIGVITSVIILFALYKLMGVLIAGNLVNFIEKNILLNHYTPWITHVTSTIVPDGALKEILVGEFGLLTMTVQYIIGVLLPLIISFNIFMAVLEDSGYLPRLAVLTDRMLTKIGLNGRAVIPIILGFGCVTMATISTRILGSKRERTIVTAILGLVVPCSAQLGIIVGLMAVAGGLKAWIIYLLSIFTILVSVGTVLNKILPGKSTHLLIDLPPMRLPVLKNVFSKTFSKTMHFLKEATPLFFLGAFIVTILKISGGLGLIQNTLAPLTVSLLHLPSEAATIFIMGLIRRDFGAAGLAKMAGLGSSMAVLTPDQVLVCLVVITLFVPCIASVIVMFKERGWKEASLVWFGSWVIAFIAGGILSSVLGLMI
ncbi:MAG: ferrous iron transporter B [Candidatus Gastranaerophilales bacterium]|nr:ferrous iron transporter B [Candidatus Gastranaerophilales bacterium]